MGSPLEVVFQIFISIILPATVAFLTATYLKEHEVKFTKLHELRIEKISTLYGKIAKTKKLIASVIQGHVVSKEDYSKDNTSLDDAIEAIFDLEDFFDENAIFFSEKVVQNMTDLSETLRDITVDFLIFTDRELATKNEDYAKEAFEALKVASEKFSTVIPKVVNSLEDDFRNLMGVAT